MRSIHERAVLHRVRIQQSRVRIQQSRVRIQQSRDRKEAVLQGVTPIPAARSVNRLDPVAMIPNGRLSLVVLVEPFGELDGPLVEAALDGGDLLVGFRIPIPDTTELVFQVVEALIELSQILPLIPIGTLKPLHVSPQIVKLAVQ